MALIKSEVNKHIIHPDEVSAMLLMTEATT